MKCLEIKKLIPDYLENELQPKERQIVARHLEGCSGCQKELEAFEKSWAFLAQWESVPPQPDYISRFWTEVSLRQPWHRKVLETFKNYVPRNRFLMPSLATVCLILIMGLFAVRNYFSIQNSEKALAQLSQDDLEMVQLMDLAENYDMIKDIEFFEDLDVIENLDSLES